MRCTMGLALVLCGVTVLGAGGARASQPEIVPFFVGTPYDFTVDVSPPGLESFVFTGEARDVDASQVVSITAGFLPPRYDFSTTSGNPAMFTVRVDNLTYADRGTRSFGLSAQDSLGAPASAVFTVRVVPEPVASLVLALVCTVPTRHRRTTG